MVPQNDTTQIEELERRFDLLARSASDSFKSTKDSNKLIAGFSADLIPLMNDIRSELTDHRGRLATLERSHSSHDGRLTAIEALVFRKDK